MTKKTGDPDVPGITSTTDTSTAGDPDVPGSTSPTTGDSDACTSAGDPEVPSDSGGPCNNTLSGDETKGPW